MRVCVSSISSGNFDLCLSIAKFLRKIYDGFFSLPISHRGEFGKKLTVMKSSLQKVENICFNIKLRGEEYPNSHLTIIEEMSAQDFQM